MSGIAVWIKSEKVAVGELGFEERRFKVAEASKGSKKDVTKEDKEAAASKRTGEWSWQRGTMQNDNAVLRISLDGNPDSTIEVPSSCLQDTVVIANDFEDYYPDDLAAVTNLHEPAVVTCLQHRYLRETPSVYTFTGPVLLAMNPFEHYDSLYSKEVMESYWIPAEKGLPPPSKPHVYGIADSCFRNMMRAIELKAEPNEAMKGEEEKNENETTKQLPINQTLLVSGESGSGKTVTTKYAMKYLALLSQRVGPDGTRAYLKAQRGENALEASSLEAQVLESNPILESFGNARTVRNDNSSRFGKLVEMQFTGSGKLVGNKIETYLLEKVRLVSQGIGERNFHIFYQLLSDGALTDAERETLELPKTASPENFLILQSGTTTRRDGVSDLETFEQLKNAMTTMGFTEQDRLQVFKIVAFVLYASQITVKELEEESILDPSSESLDAACALFGVSPEDLNDGLCFSSVKIGGQEIKRAQNTAAVEKSLKALVKSVYSALFAHLVERINTKNAYNVGEEQAPSGEPEANIAILDIFGFESFAVNSLEQLCINYANEKLQYQFNTFFLKNEQSLYEQEGIEWSFIEFPDNQDTIELVENKKCGILRVLDDKCKVDLPGNADHSYAKDLYNLCKYLPRFQADRNQQGFHQFAIRHYAGIVEYTTDGFVEKNKDNFPKECLSVLVASTNSLVPRLATLIESRFEIAANEQLRDTKAHPSVTAQFRSQLTHLSNKISATEPHYIRCIKPNDSLKAGEFDAAVVAEQLECGGILEVIRVARAGFTQHCSHKAFVQRYRTMAWKEMETVNPASTEIMDVGESESEESTENENIGETTPEEHDGTSPQPDLDANTEDGAEKASALEADGGPEEKGTTQEEVEEGDAVEADENKTKEARETEESGEGNEEVHTIEQQKTKVEDGQSDSDSKVNREEAKEEETRQTNGETQEPENESPGQKEEAPDSQAQEKNEEATVETADSKTDPLTATEDEEGDSKTDPVTATEDEEGVKQGQHDDSMKKGPLDNDEKATEEAIKRKMKWKAGMKIPLKQMTEKMYAKECKSMINVFQKKLLQGRSVDDEEAYNTLLIQMGKTRVFFRHKAFELLELLRSHSQEKAATLLNSTFRRHISRTAYLHVRDAFRQELMEKDIHFDIWCAENCPNINVVRRPMATAVSQNVRLFVRKIKNKPKTTLTTLSRMHGLDNGDETGKAQWFLKDGVWKHLHLQSKDGKSATNDVISFSDVLKDPESKGRSMATPSA